jgi:hypothetical protein
MILISSGKDWVLYLWLNIDIQTASGAFKYGFSNSWILGWWENALYVISTLCNQLQNAVEDPVKPLHPPFSVMALTAFKVYDFGPCQR